MFLASQTSDRIFLNMPNAERLMAGYGHSMVFWRFGDQDNVAADLIDLPVSPVLAEIANKPVAADVSGQPHATASTSSRTM